MIDLGKVRWWGLAVLGLLAVGTARADDPLPAPRSLSDWTSPNFSSVLLQDPFSLVNEKPVGGTERKRPHEPEHIRDNAMLVEEASNQEPGVVQHIFDWVQQWDRTREAENRELIFVYTMELPLGSQTHQFSFTTSLQDLLERPRGGPADHQGGVGDTLLNYRYQLLADDAFLWCSPRFSLILPTGDERFSLGNGQLGYQFNLPVSKYGDRFDFHFNAGCTYIPGVSTLIADGTRSNRQDLRGYNVGVSVYWKPQTNLHFFVEVLALHNEELDDAGFRNHLNQVFINPGIRYAVCQFEEVEWVIGLGVPIGVSEDTPDIGLFFYMSVEHSFRKLKKDGE